MDPHRYYADLRMSLDHLDDAMRALKALNRLMSQESSGTLGTGQEDRSVMLNALVVALFVAQEEIEEVVELMWPSEDDEIPAEHHGDVLC